jgi:hypothetical protein
MLTVLDEAPSDEERQQSLANCMDLLKGFRSVSSTKGRLWHIPDIGPIADGRA